MPNPETIPYLHPMTLVPTQVERVFPEDLNPGDYVLIGQNGDPGSRSVLRRVQKLEQGRGGVTILLEPLPSSHGSEDYAHRRNLRYRLKSAAVADPYADIRHALGCAPEVSMQGLVAQIYSLQTGLE